MTSNTNSDKMRLAPLRTINDFVLDFKRYITPPFSDLKRFNNRVTSNLLYYQTNYFVLSTLIFLITMFFRFGTLLAGVFGVVFAVGSVMFSLNRIPQASAIKSQYPMLVYGVFIMKMIIVYATFRSMIYLLIVLLVPVLFWILHASVRSRGLKNKISNKMEQMGAHVYTDTPMGHLLQSLGIEARDLEE